MVDRDQDRQSNPDHASHDAPRAKGNTGALADPLAELARLIGQADPFANFGRANPSHPTRRTQPIEPSPQSYSERVREQISDVPSSVPSWMKHRSLQNRPPLPNPSPAEPVSEDDTDINATPHPLHRYAAQQAHIDPTSQDLPDHESPSFAAGHYAHEQGPHESYAQPYDPGHPDNRYDDALYGAAQPSSEEHYAQLQGHGAGYVDDGYGYADTDAEADERKPRRKGMAAVAAVVALAVVGTGGAYAYRNFVGSTRSVEPPVIKADTAPIKVVPPTNASDAAANSKLIQDRLAASGSGAEKLVSREETPVDPRDPSKAGPRVIFPPLNANGNPPSTASVSPAGRSMAAPQTAPGDEPRKIKTFAVKGDQSDANGVPVARPTPRTPTATSAKQSGVAPGAAGALPAATASQPAMRVATTTPAPTAPAASAGAYSVQIASQPSESEAQSSLRALQAKYGSVLGSRSAQVKKHENGQKVVYRVLVGSFGSSDEAAQLCGSLKSAGGQCFVQRN